MRILIVDDEPFVIDNLRMALERLGHSVLTVTFHDQVEEIAGSHHFDAAILDIEMGVVKGTAVLRQLKTATPREFPYVFYTKYSRGSAQWDEAQKAGTPAHRIIQKVDVSEDFQEILDALRRR